MLHWLYTALYNSSRLLKWIMLIHFKSHFLSKFSVVTFICRLCVFFFFFLLFLLLTVRSLQLYIGTSRISSSAAPWCAHISLSFSLNYLDWWTNRINDRKSKQMWGLIRDWHTMAFTASCVLCEYHKYSSIKYFCDVKGFVIDCSTGLRPVTCCQ